MRLVSVEFERFIARHFGAEGRAWLDGLPDRVERCLRDWQLEIERFLPGGLLACCLAVGLPDGDPGVLKLGGRWAPAALEAVALRHWNGAPAPVLIAADERGDALLLERITPGAPFTGDRARAQDVESVAGLIASLHAPAPSERERRLLPLLGEIVERLLDIALAEALARSASEAARLRPRVEQARQTAARLLDSQTAQDRLLHGDLEPKNILVCHRRGLVVIDPMPCVGDPAYDAGDSLACSVQPDHRPTAARVLARRLGLDPDRVRSWTSIIAPSG